MNYIFNRFIPPISKFCLAESDGSQSDVMSAAKGNGAGTYLFDWGTDATTAAKSIELTVPGSTTKYAEKYATKLTWTLTDAPGN